MPVNNKTAPIAAVLFSFLLLTVAARSRRINKLKYTDEEISELAATGAVFLKHNARVNCFGLPLELFTKELQTALDDTKEDDVRFYITTKQHPNYRILKSRDNLNLKQVNFDISRDTIVVVHGFLSSGQETWIKELTAALLRYDDTNVIVVDWQKGSNTWNYLSAAYNTKIVGQEIAKLFARIRQTMRRNKVSRGDWGKIHFIGHSLGAHISARAAFGINESQRGRASAWNVTRITGLDPAQPCFKTSDVTLKLTRDKADFVDIIHTNAPHLLYLGLGLPDQLGHLDFYPNGGKFQPGCSKIESSMWDFLKLPKKIVKRSICSHGRSHEFFTESIVDAINGNCSFHSHKWDQKYENIEKLLAESCFEEVCPEMGISAVYSFPFKQGVFFVPTGDAEPFCTIQDDQKREIEAQLVRDKALEESFFTRVAAKFFKK